MGAISGIVKENGSPVGGRVVRAYRLDNGELLGSAVSSDGAPIPGDPHLSDRVLLIRGSGETITDECPTPRTITAEGNASIVAADSSFGGGAIGFDGSGDYLLLDGHSSLAFGMGDFTIKMRVQPASVSSDRMLIDFRPAGVNGAYPCLYLNGGYIAYYVSSAEVISGAHGLSAGIGYDILLCRRGGVTRLFIDDVQIGSSYTDTANYAVGANRPIIGANSFSTSSSNYNGLMGLISLSRRADLDEDNKPLPQPFYTDAPSDGDPLGTYSIHTSYTGEVVVVCLDDAAGTAYGDLIVRTTPV